MFLLSPDMNNRPRDESQFHAQIRRDRELRDKSYRAQALRLLPHVCGSCGREFAGKRLRELTVHHKDHDHTNNPPDGSNWEFLCLYCHDHEHEKFRMKGFGSATAVRNQAGPALSNPFEQLDSLLTNKPKMGEADHADNRR